MTGSRFLALVLTAGALLAPAVVWGQPAVPEDSLGIQLMDAPVARADDPRALVAIVDHVGPGTSFSRRVQVVHGFEGERGISLEVVAAELENGTFEIRDDVHTPLLEWIELDEISVVAAQQEPVVVRASFDLPADAPEGEYYGAILAGVRDEADGGLSTVSRVGVRIYLSVGQGGEPASNFSITSMTAVRTPAGEPIVEVEVENTGGRALDISGELELSDGPGGTSAGPFVVDRGPSLAPGQVTSIVFGPLSVELPAGPWRARADLRSGLIERSAEALIQFPEAAGETADPVEATEVPLHQDRGILIPLAIGLLILALALVVLVWFLAKRRRDDEDEEAATGTEATVGATE